PPSFASTDPIECWITKNGVLIIDQIVRQDQWYVVGGPAMKVDFTVSRTPDWVRKIISENFVDKPIGIYRVAKDEIPNRLWVGELPKFTRQYSKTTSFGKIINFKIVQNTLSDSLARLTYGALGYVLDFPLRQQTADFWDNIRIEEWGFFPADLSST
ncbi:hypothetical protein OEZ82_26170, partial [Leclercia adecarboxylata]|uniref:hypothetical protein n=1 Tax=Leclercia adecarboxylata TaxID=83655 RepID=UPI00234C3013